MTIYEYNSEIIQFTTWGPYLREKIIRRREREWYFTGSLWAEAQQWHDFLFLRVFADINFPIFQWDSDPIGTVQWQHQQPDGSQPYRDILKLKFGFSKKNRKSNRISSYLSTFLSELFESHLSIMCRNIHPSQPDILIVIRDTGNFARRYRCHRSILLIVTYSCHHELCKPSSSSYLLVTLAYCCRMLWHLDPLLIE